MMDTWNARGEMDFALAAMNRVRNRPRRFHWRVTYHRLTELRERHVPAMTESEMRALWGDR